MSNANFEGCSPWQLELQEHVLTINFSCTIILAYTIFQQWIAYSRCRAILQEIHPATGVKSEWTDDETVTNESSQTERKTHKRYVIYVVITECFQMTKLNTITVVRIVSVIQASDL